MDRVAADNRDPWPHYELGLLYDELGDDETALAHYGRAINLLPPRSYTRPVLNLGKIHHRQGRSDAAERCYREVLDTFPERPSLFRENPDYREAALGVGSILTDQGEDDTQLEQLRTRYLGELGGTEAEWEAGPWWLPSGDDDAGAGVGDDDATEPAGDE